ncbi:hypothetical protein BGZ49_001461 [Haplosporangium sp. Z 27]|nr:hypothetical protein BGZ49_001461 [Haplosporangium sp. Z 27]
MTLNLNSRFNVFTDATPSQGAWINNKGSSRVFPVPNAYQHSSFESEYYTVHRAIIENAKPGMEMNLFCDHQGLCSTLQSRTMRHPQRHAHLNQHFSRLMNFMQTNDVRLNVSWIPSEYNPADSLSRSHR